MNDVDINIMNAMETTKPVSDMLTIAPRRIERTKTIKALIMLMVPEPNILPRTIFVLDTGATSISFRKPN